MNGHLIDTHALLWALTEPARLSDAARAVIADATVPLHVSAASAWEIATKRRLGRLGHAESLITNYSGVLERLGVRSVPITDLHALIAGGLEWDHRDPFDRMLAAVATLEGWTLVTRDPAFATLPGLRTLW